MNTKTKNKIKEYIREYAGANFLFLRDFIEGGDYETYVLQNIDKIAYKNVFGKQMLRQEFRKFNGYEVRQHILDTCKKTIEYVKGMLKNE